MSDSMDLPSRRVVRRPETPVTLMSEPRGGLTERQVDVLVTSAANIATGLMEIVKLKAQTQQEIELIEARSQALRVAIQGEIDNMKAARETITTRGDEAIRLTRELMRYFPDADPATRQVLLETLTKLVDSTINGKGVNPASGA